MAYTDDGVKAKLSALNETQEGIVSCSQWIMFHRRYADRTAAIWMQRLKDSSASKRLNLVYLANEVIQQSKARKKEEFAKCFSPIIAEATSIAYRGATNDIQQKLRRVIEVWRQRAIFETAVQDEIERRVDEIDRTRATTKKQTLGGSLFSSSSNVPSELQPLVSSQNMLTRASLALKPAASTANAEFARLTDPATPVPTPPVHAARLSALLKTLATAEGAVAESIRARQALMEGLERLLASNRAGLQVEEQELEQLRTRSAAIEARRRDIEDGIMRGISSDQTQPLPLNGLGGSEEPPRPEIESFTPPPVESITPIGTPPPQLDLGQPADDVTYLEDMNVAHGTTTGADPRFLAEQPPNHNEPAPGEMSSTSLAATGDPRRRGREITPNERAVTEDGMNGGSFQPPVKRQKRNHSGEEFAEFTGDDALEGLDDDVAKMLGDV